LRVGDRNDWTGRGVTHILHHPIYVGKIVTNTKRIQREPDTGKKTKKPNPRQKWVIYAHPELQVWSWKRWKQIRRRLREIAKMHPGRLSGVKSRVHLTTLLSGSLFSGSCGRELSLYRSDKGKWRQFHCPNGIANRCGCMRGRLRSGESADAKCDRLRNGVLGGIACKSVPDPYANATRLATKGISLGHECGGTDG